MREIAWLKEKETLTGEIERLRSEVGVMARRYRGARRETQDLVMRLQAQPPPPVPQRLGCTHQGIVERSGKGKDDGKSGKERFEEERGEEEKGKEEREESGASDVSGNEKKVEKEKESESETNKPDIKAKITPATLTPSKILGLPLPAGWDDVEESLRGDLELRMARWNKGASAYIVKFGYGAYQKWFEAKSASKLGAEDLVMIEMGLAGGERLSKRDRDAFLWLIGGGTTYQALSLS